MNRMLPVEPFKAEYQHTDDVAQPEWRPCTIVGIGPSDRYAIRPYFIGIATHNGKTFPVEPVEVIKQP